MGQQELSEIIQGNQNIPFIQRLINRYIYPVINNPEGTQSSHKMMWGQVNDKYIVFPSIELVNGKLTDMLKAGIDPMEQALQNKNFIEFDSPNEAEWFTKNYKKYFGVE
uniref:Uncharacterized protein n=1 Tax=viral metagenome TaxID=1070528 RepID=A0A6M3JS11_9ZZZZ